MTRRSFLTRGALCAVVAAAVLSRTAIAANDPFEKAFGGPFKLTSDDGRVVSDTDFRGRFMLIFFGYTHCPDICPTDLSVMTEALILAAPASDAIQPIFITVDPARDTTEHLASYRRSFHPRLIALTGSEAEIAAVARAYKVHRRKYVTPNAPAEDYGVDHGSLMYLMGPDGRFKTLIPHGTAPARIAEIITRYIIAVP